MATPRGGHSFYEKSGALTLELQPEGRQDSHPDLRASVEPLVTNQQDLVRLLQSDYLIWATGTRVSSLYVPKTFVIGTIHYADCVCNEDLRLGEAMRHSPVVTVEDFRRFADVFSGLLDPELMAKAWE
jgi:hypothetical protein